MKTKKLNFIELPVSSLLPHPKNEEMFPENQHEEAVLAWDIAKNLQDGGQGILVPIMVNSVNLHGEYGNGGKYIVLSGHRRLRAAKMLGIERVMCDVREIQSQTYELMLLCSLNVGRGFKDVYKIRLFKGAKQFLCQLRKNPDLLRDAGDDDSEISSIRNIVLQRGVKLGKGVKTEKVIEALFGFTKREQDPLTWLCDEDYRADYLAGLSIPKKEKARLLGAWADVELAALNEDITLKEAIKIVEKFRKQCKDAAAGKVKEPKQDVKRKTGPEIVDVEEIRSRFLVEPDEIPAFGYYYLGDTADDSRLIIPNEETSKYALITIQDLFKWVGFPLPEDQDISIN